MADLNLADPPLVRVHWADAFNIATWMHPAEIEDMIEGDQHLATNVGYLLHESDDCVVVAARASSEQYGLVERIPRGMVTSIEHLKVKKQPK